MAGANASGLLVEAAAIPPPIGDHFDLPAVLGVASADFNRDSRLDAAFSGYLTGGTALVGTLNGNGDGTSDSIASLPLPAGTTPKMLYRLLVRDFNNDAKTGLAAVSPDLQAVVIDPGNGDGTFAVPSVVPTGIAAYELQAADLRGNGPLDLVALSNTENKVPVLFSNGDGTFAAPVVIGTATTTSRQFVQFIGADLRGNGRLDLIGLGAAVEVFLNNCDGTFAPAVNDRGYAADVKAADLNGDDIADLAVANYFGNLSILAGNCDGPFADPVNDAVGSPSANTVDIGDLDGDGRLDLVIQLEANGSGFYGTPLKTTVLINASPLNVTSRVAVNRGGYVYNRKTGHFTQSATITNTSNAAILGPIRSRSTSSRWAWGS